MLETINMVGYALTSMSYNTEAIPDDQGQYQLTVESVGDMQFSHDDEDEYILKSKFKSEITGTSDTSKSTAFKLAFEFTIFFETTKETFEFTCNNDDYLKSNKWFFTNFAHVLVREIGEDVFNHTSYKGLRLPNGR